MRISWRVCVHRTELEHAEPLSVQAHPLLLEKPWSFGIELDKDAQQEEKWETDNQQNSCTGEVENPFSPLVCEAIWVSAE